MVWSEENVSLKNPVTPRGIDPGTVRLVAQRLGANITVNLQQLTLLAADSLSVP